MARAKTTQSKTVASKSIAAVPRRKKAPANPLPSTQKEQSGQTFLPYLSRYLPTWGTPSWYEAARWRSLVRNQPIAMICKEALQSTIAAMDWMIVPRDTSQVDSLKKEIDYYTELFTDDGNYDFADRVEWMVQDLLDLPFGAACEVGREGDTRDGKVHWMVPLDGGTLFPTLNMEWPVGQLVGSVGMTDPIYFTKNGISRVYMTPRTEIERAGWGMAPPEKIFLALISLWRGDQYYANLLLDTPEAGILDLGDMAKDSAEDWILSFRDLMTGVDPFKIPVLYEHEKEAKFISFGKPPTEILFDKISLKYAAFVAAGYGLTLGDIGVQSTFGSGGETLAGSIREERRARRSGRALTLRKLRNWHNRILPRYLDFHWIDQDEELNQGIARARLGNATALNQMVDGGIIDRAEARMQMIADRMFSIRMSEKIPPSAAPTDKHASIDEMEDKKQEGQGGNNNPNVVDQLERPVAPSKGGHGDIKQESLAETTLRDFLLPKFRTILWNLTEGRTRRLIRATVNALLPTMQRAVQQSPNDELLLESEWLDKVLAKEEVDVESYVASMLDTVSDFTQRASEFDAWWKIYPTDEEYEYMQKPYRSWFLLGSSQTMRRLTTYLYEIGRVNEEEPPPPTLDVASAIIVMMLMNRSRAMIALINEGTQTFIDRALLSVVRRQLVLTGMADLLRDGVDVETIMSNNGFIGAVSRELKERLKQEFANRLNTIDAYEESWTVNRAAWEQLAALGLQKKRWAHDDSYGDKPCERYCQIAIDAGEVVLSYKYDTAFGPSEFGPGHPECHCGVYFVPSEVQRLLSTGEFPITNWRGA